MVSHRIANQVYQGLLRFDQETLKSERELQRAGELATMVLSTHSICGRFLFHDDPCLEEKGREITFEDVRYCFTKLCEYDGNNKLFGMFQDRVLGATEYYGKSRQCNGNVSNRDHGFR